MKTTIPIFHGNTKMVAHRGVSGLEKENTMTAFVAAGNRSYWGVETDVHFTADKKLIIIHDSNCKRLAGTELIVEETDFETLRAIPLLDKDGNPGRVDLRMPSLREYIRVCKQYGKKCVLEIKSIFPEEGIRLMLDEIREEEYLENVIFIAFDRENLIRIREYLPEQTVQQLAKTVDEELFAFLKEQKFDLDIEYKALTEEWVKRLHEAGICINSWTVNDPEAAAQLVAWGVDQITTNILE